MAVKYYLQIEGESATFDIDTEAISVTLPGVERTYEQKELFRDGCYIDGFGQFKPGKISFTKKFRANGGGTAWNSLRMAVMRWIGMPKYKKLYFYLRNSDETKTLRARVYPSSRGEEAYSSLNLSDDISFDFLMENAYFEDTENTYKNTMLSSAYQEFEFSQDGILSVPPLIEFTPKQEFWVFQVEIAEAYGFRLESNFKADIKIQFDCATGKSWIDDKEVSGIQTGGSVFNLPSGTNKMLIWACPCNENKFSVIYKERYI